MRNYKETFDALFREVDKVIVGQREVMEQIVVAMLCDSNALIEGFPGLAKTFAIRTLSRLMDLKFSRIQSTPDLMPSDITGTYIIEETTGGKRTFKFQPGPVFANIVLADEINRATPKTQSAFLEAMQEKQVTIGNSTYKLDLPFFVLATQNPIEQEGTYPLPEAQADRFLLKINIDYPTESDEEEIVNRYTSEVREHHLRTIFNKKQLLALQQIVRQVPIANDIKRKAIKIVTTTRESKNLLQFGASPRASIGIILASKARALLMGRNHVSMEDVVKLAYPVLRHRIILNFEAQRKGLKADDAIKEIMGKAK